VLRRGEWAPGVAEPQHVAFGCTDVSAAPGRPVRPVRRCCPSRTTTTTTSTPGSPRRPSSSRPCASWACCSTATSTASSCTSTPRCWAAGVLRGRSAGGRLRGIRRGQRPDPDGRAPPAASAVTRVDEAWDAAPQRAAPSPAMRCGRFRVAEDRSRSAARPTAPRRRGAPSRRGAPGRNPRPPHHPHGRTRLCADRLVALHCARTPDCRRHCGFTRQRASDPGRSPSHDRPTPLHHPLTARLGQFERTPLRGMSPRLCSGHTRRHGDTGERPGRPRRG
jgi:hypothetical protein